jgi:hypothetical protein
MNQNDQAEIFSRLRRIERKLDQLIASQQSPSPNNDTAKTDEPISPVVKVQRWGRKLLPKRPVLSPHDEVGA